MGQGLYNVLGWGTLNYPRPPHDNEGLEEAFFNELLDLEIDFDYETRPPYAIVRLAIDDEVLQKWWKLPAMPEDVYRCAPRRARYLDEAPAFPVPESANKTWTHARAIAKKHGVEWPDARYIVLNDWD